jgi:hypothetical protein
MRAAAVTRHSLFWAEALTSCHGAPQRVTSSKCGGEWTAWPGGEEAQRTSIVSSWQGKHPGVPVGLRPSVGVSKCVYKDLLSSLVAFITPRFHPLLRTAAAGCGQLAAPAPVWGGGDTRS